MNIQMAPLNGFWSESTYDDDGNQLTYKDLEGEYIRSN